MIHSGGQFRMETALLPTLCARPGFRSRALGDAAVVMTNSAGHVVAATFAGFSGRQIVVGLIGVAVILVVLGVPVLGETLLGFVAGGALRLAPSVFVIGLVVLLVGLLAGMAILTVIGACLLGVILLGVVLKNY
jgi:hypothetical protein